MKLSDVGPYEVGSINGMEVVERHLRSARVEFSGVSFLEACMAKRYGPFNLAKYQQTIPRDNLEIGLRQLNATTTNLNFETLLPPLDLACLATKTPPHPTNHKHRLELLEAIVVYCSRIRDIQTSIPTGHPPNHSIPTISSLPAPTHSDRLISKLLAFIGHITSIDSREDIMTPHPTDTHLPPFCLQLAAVEMSELVLEKLNLGTNWLPRLAVALIPGILHFQPEYVQRLFDLIVTRILVALVRNQRSDGQGRDPVPAFGAWSRVKSGLEEIILPTLQSIASRFTDIEHVNRCLPNFEGWLRAMYLLVPSSLGYGLQYLLTQHGVHLNLAFQLFGAVCPSWLGHTVVTSAPDDERCRACSYIPYLTPSSEDLRCAECHARVPRVALVCVGCQARVHVKCCIGQNFGLSLVNPGIAFSFSLGDGRDLAWVSVFEAQRCGKCHAPLWGTCLQALQCTSRQELFHPACITRQLSQVQQPSPQEVTELLTRPLALEAPEYHILHDWLEMQLARLHASTPEADKLRVAMRVLEARKPASTIETSVLYSYPQLLKVSSRLGEGEAKDPRWSLEAITANVKRQLGLRSDVAARLVILHLVAHGLAAVVGGPDGNRVYVPFSPLHGDHINLRAVARCFSSGDPAINEYGFLITRRLPPAYRQNIPQNDPILRSSMAWLACADQPSVKPAILTGRCPPARAQLVARYLLPELTAARAQLGDAQLAAKLFSFFHPAPPCPAPQTEAALEVILQCQAAGFPEELIGSLLNLWVVPFLAALEELPLPQDPAKLARKVLLERLRGVVLVETSAATPSILHEGSFLYTRALRNSPPHLAAALAWLRLFSIAQVVIPDALELLAELLEHPSLDERLAVQAFNFIFHQMCLPSQPPADPCRLLASKFDLMPMRGWLEDASTCQALVELAVAISLLVAGHRPPMPLPFTLPLLPLRLIPQTGLSPTGGDPDGLPPPPLNPSDRSTEGPAHLLLTLARVCSPSKVHLALQGLRLVCAGEKPAYLSCRLLIGRLWYLLDLAHGVDTVVSDLFFNAGDAAPAFVLSCVRLDTAGPDFDRQWGWLDCAFGFLSRVTPDNARLHPDAWQYVGPLFDEFIGLTASTREPLRTKSEALMHAFEASALRNLLQFWEIYFDATPIAHKITTCRRMIHLNLLFPHWAVVHWRSLIGLLSLAMNKAETPQNVTIQGLAFQLTFQMLANGVTVVRREFFTLLFLMAKGLGFTDAKLEVQDGAYSVSLGELTVDCRDHPALVHAFLSQLKRLLDEPAIMHDDRTFSDELQRLDPDPQTSTSQLQGVQFMELFFKLATGCLEPIPSVTLIIEIVECAMVLFYKYPIDPPSTQDLAVLFIERLCPLLTAAIPEKVVLALLNLFYVMLQRVPKVTQHTLATQFLAVVSLLDQRPWAEGDPVLVKAHYFLFAAFHAYSSNGIYILLLKHYDHPKRGDALFKVLARVLKRDLHGLRIKEMDLPNRKAGVAPLDQPLFDVMQRVLGLPLENYEAFNTVLANTLRYVQQVHPGNFGEGLLLEYFATFLPRFARRVAEWPPAHLDLTPILAMTALILRNHPFVAEIALPPIRGLLRATLGRFPFHAHALTELLGSVAQLPGELGPDSAAEFGAILLEEFAAALLRTKPAISSAQVVAMCQVLVHPTWVLAPPVDLMQEEPPAPAADSDDVPLRLTRLPKLLAFREMPSALFPNLAEYLDNPLNFNTPQSQRAGWWGGYLLAALYLLREVPTPTVYAWIGGLSPRRGLLALAWFLLMLSNVADGDHRESLHALQPNLVEVICRGLAIPASSPTPYNTSHTLEGSGTPTLANASGTKLVGSSLTLPLTMLIVKIWASLFSRTQFSNQGQPPADSECDDPFVGPSLQTSFWLAIWPTLLAAITAYPTDTEPYSLTSPVDAFCQLVLFLAQSMALLPSPFTLAPEWTRLLDDLATLDHKLSVHPPLKLARALLVGDAVALPFSPITSQPRS
ncbi:hypothetical protein L0F63_004338 [Massospora cicadina]|nr:hypothetical protein L0F63_004338 [Massospora cicadina]